MQIEIVNLVPRFLTFYENAITVETAEERWSLWKEHYNFAAVPPGDEGIAIAKQMLEDNWSLYRQLISKIKEWKPNTVQLENLLSEVKTLLGYNGDVRVVLIYFVGGFEANPFVAPYQDNQLALCLPIESECPEFMIAHELIHVVHTSTASLKVGWERPVASLVIQEVLATRGSQVIVPVEVEEAYISHRPGWYEHCVNQTKEIFEGILPDLAQETPEMMIKYTFGKGTTNIEREGYYVGWILVNYLLENGWTFKEIASIPEVDLAIFVRENIQKYLTQKVYK